MGVKLSTRFHKYGNVSYWTLTNTDDADRNKAEAGKSRAPSPAFIHVLNKYVDVIANCAHWRSPK